MARSGCEQCGKPFSEQNRRRLCTVCRGYGVCACGGKKSRDARACRKCLTPARGSASATYKKGATRHKSGYVMELVPGHGYIMQHILVMEDMIGRLLVPGENVHHINGVRDDNRPENLELWTRPQPTGVRAADAVRHAVETLSRYAPDLLA